jgi:hypothetical protein
LDLRVQQGRKAHKALKVQQGLRGQQGRKGNREHLAQEPKGSVFLILLAET